MAHVVFTADFDFTPKEDRRATIAYPEGWQGSVRADCANEAIAAGKAKKVAAPKRAPA